ncbi:MAG: HAMP domain-containing histidine kinase [Pseudonocardiales bacterium]|nr:HAMP domain-containing histidine kinase [Pseudonocardiales bacterium]
MAQRGPIVDIVGAAAVSVLAIVLLNTGIAHAVLAVEPTFRVLTVAAAAAGATAALLAAITARLTGDPRPSWIAASLVLYCVIVLPWTTVAAAELDVMHRASRLVAYLGALVLLLLAIRPPRMLRAWGGWMLLLATGLLAIVVLELPASAAMAWLVDGPLLTVAVLGGWTAAAAAFVADGYRRRSRPRLRLGLGLVVLAVAQLYRVADDPSTPSTDIAFATLRLVGLLIVFGALAQLTQLALRSVETAQWRQQEELAAAALHMERAQEAAAERDHELRNGLAGLAGITHLLSADGGSRRAGSEEHERLKHAVLAELGRLHAILDGGLLAVGPIVDYTVEPVIAGLVALRTSGAVAFDVEPGLHTTGDPAVLAQIVTNLLVNCERHAPGAMVTVTARRRGNVVTIEVRDEGPGLPQEGQRVDPRPGSGLGLPISRRLAATQGGQLLLRTVTDPRGCAATLSLPVAPAQVEDKPVTDGNLPSVFHRT